MLKRAGLPIDGTEQCQPPSGGCVLKRTERRTQRRGDDPAAFRRLCVETIYNGAFIHREFPAAFRRLCVETIYIPSYFFCFVFPAAFRRLCVETLFKLEYSDRYNPAAFRRLCVETPATVIKTLVINPAAFRRLCVETAIHPSCYMASGPSRLQAAVC